ncbi:hypothetical protein CEJ63_20710, partial [Acinetobacter baumannii]
MAESHQVIVSARARDLLPQCRRQHGLDFVEVDPVAGDLQEALGATGDVMEAVLVDAGQVAGAQHALQVVTFGQDTARGGVAHHHVWTGID